MDAEDIKKELSDKIKIISNALYRVTDLLSDKEPLKWSLRTMSVKTHEDIMSVIIYDNNAANKSIILNDIFNNLSRIINTLELAGAGSYISSLNFEVLKKEYLNLKIFLEGGKKVILESNKNILPEIFNVNLLVEAPKEQIDSIGQKQEKDPSAVSIEKEVAVPAPVNFLKSAKEDNLDARKKRIFSFIKTSGPKTISEITPLFTDISEKTIQRDLLELVKMGEIKAEGEKRWRRYKLT